MPVGEKYRVVSRIPTERSSRGPFGASTDASSSCSHANLSGRRDGKEASASSCRSTFAVARATRAIASARRTTEEESRRSAAYPARVVKTLEFAQRQGGASTT